MTPVEVTEDDLKALKNVLGYLWADEANDYELNPCSSHVFLAAKALNSLAYRVAEGLDDA
jgi:hypothetical protein